MIIISCKLIFVRHGQSLGNEKRIYLGHTDLDLSELGYKQAELTSEFLKKIKIDRIYCSDLQRAYHTSLPLAEKLKLEPEKRENLREIFAGEWENKNYDYLTETYPESYGIWKTNVGLAHPDGGESVISLQKRIVNEVTKIAEENDGKTVAVFTHATPIRTFFSFIRGYSAEEIKDMPWATNASISEAVFENGKFSEIDYSRDDFMGSMVSAFPAGI